MATVIPAVRRAARQYNVVQARYAIPVAIVAFIGISIVASHEQYSYLAQLAIAGLPNGAAAALSGLGLVLTYRTTGVFNFAQGAIATFVAYIFWSLTTNHGWPIAPAAIVAMAVIGPSIGVAADFAIFRPLQRRQASTSEKIVASLGLTVLFIGICSAIWGLGSKRSPSPLPFAGKAPLHPFGQAYPIGYDVIGNIVIVGLVAIGLTLVFRFTRLGTEIRAVVDKRQLAELSAVNANRVSAIAWALGCGFAGLVGVLFANTVALDPYRTTLLVLDTFAVAVIARLRNMPTAVVAGLLLGCAQAMLRAYPGNVVPNEVGPNLLAILLLVFLVAYQSLDEIGESLSSARGVVTGRLGGARRLTPPKLLWGVAVGVLAIAMPLLVHGQSQTQIQEILALTIALLSIVAITGFSGNISLCQAAFAGLGAFLTAKFSTVGLWFIPSMPVIPAILLAAILLVPVGIVTGYPSLRRKGLILGLSTLAVGIIIDAFIFNNDNYYAGLGAIHRPHLFGLSLEGDHAYYWFELVVVVLMMFLVRNLRSGRLGRILAAMRDSDAGASSSGISLRRYKLFIFAASAFVAAIGGSLFMLANKSFQEQQFSPLYSLFWFTAVVVAGLGYLSGAAIAAIIFIGLDALLNQQGASLFIIGAVALLIPFLPGGLVGTYLRLTEGGWVPRGLMRKYAQARATALEGPASEPVEQAPELVASDLARELLVGARR
jgi:branched-chain amino acid transport system permease protein